MKKTVLIVSFFIQLLFFYEKAVSEIERSPEEIKLEIKILEKISKDIIRKDKIRVFLIGYDPKKLLRYSSGFILVKDCSKADIVIAKENDKGELSSCRKDIPGIALKYSLLRKDSIFIGALFWYKGRPNLVFIRKRLEKLNIKLPKSYSRYIEDQIW